jgi:hypothetical protein
MVAACDRSTRSYLEGMFCPASCDLRSAPSRLRLHGLLRLWASLTLALGSGAVSASCVVRERTIERPLGCPGGFCVERHRGSHGRWHEAHSRCPGVVERIEIE